MKTLFSAALIVTALTVSAGAYAHWGNMGDGNMGYGNGMMNGNYQTMQGMHRDPQAMQQRHQMMRNNPQARQQWMQQMQANGGRGQHFAMHGNHRRGEGFAMRGSCGGNPGVMGKGMGWHAQPDKAPAPAPKAAK
ncbi:hypothetical protein KDN34_16695 [Shewanella yunxiaonensis]|uniref:Zinc resistance-associated protein n=1 Tax=Shewanella yunxiaonensis TaxID=2829809 RepID=A0ABX7YT09_9GAMM|nr:MULTISPECIES: hypothetical protein [Shewanella]MDF0533408.1 hypothetical protein [Shewanella sp. A32]QUN05789.1 hypothetical protein KDN34_16695 [Shewanella yunxiaonensis]